jgi:holo-[acyl-carrier protein] synthase
VPRYGLGVDIEEVGRFGSLLRNKRFLARIYTPQEITYCRSKKNKLQHFAVRFAAKEAVWKALSEALAGSKVHLGHRDIGIRNTETGKPHVTLPKKLRKLESKLQVSLSHTRSYVVAVAVLHG